MHTRQNVQSMKTEHDAESIDEAQFANSLEYKFHLDFHLGRYIRYLIPAESPQGIYLEKVLRNYEGSYMRKSFRDSTVSAQHFSNYF